MAVQARNDVTYRKFIVRGTPQAVNDGVMVKNTGATHDIVERTVLFKNPATGKWSPYISATGTDGSEFPRGIYVGDTITTTDIKAADVGGCKIIVGGNFDFDESLILFENTSIDLDTEITNQNLTVGDALISLGMLPKKVDFISQLENS